MNKSKSLSIVNDPFMVYIMRYLAGETSWYDYANYVVNSSQSLGEVLCLLQDILKDDV